MHQIEEMHIFLITVVIETMDIATKVIFSEIILSNYYMHFLKKYSDYFMKKLNDRHSLYNYKKSGGAS